MMDALAHNWGWIALRGLVGLAFGVITLSDPFMGLTFLVVLFGIYAILDGIFAGIAATANRHDQPQWTTLLISGIIGIIIGIAAFVWPGMSEFGLLYLIALWAVIIGIGEISAWGRLRRTISGEWLLLLAGVISIAFGVLIALFPGSGALATLFWIGAFTAVLGILRIALGFRLRYWLHGGNPALAEAHAH